MRIEASMINMESSRKYFNYTNKKEDSIVTRAEDAPIFELSTEGKDVVEQMKDHKDNKKAAQKKQQEEALAKSMAERLKNSEANNSVKTEFKDELDMQLDLLRKILRNISKYYGKNSRFSKENNPSKSIKIEAMQSAREETSFSITGQSIKGIDMTNAKPLQSAKWVKTTATSVFMTETENTTFNSTGLVKTSDGREITFGVSVEMSRAFCAKYDSITREDVIFTDPLVFNMDSNVANISDQKFLFDLNSDGKEEEISFAGKGSGFLALDKNGDGKINDGSELFGTKSGNGFKDLAEYDTDKNGWIDENDDIFNDLRIWTKDSEGNDRLLTLKESDVGAIFLGYVDTEFTVNNMETNGVNGIVRGTGIFLKESGGTGTVQHIDLAL